MIKNISLLSLFFASSYLCAADHKREVFYYAKAKQWDKVYQLIESGAVDVNIAPKISASISTEPKEYYPLLIMATIEGNIDATFKLLRLGANINSNHFITPLMGAICYHFNRQDNLPLINFLLERGANPLRKDKYNRTSFDYTNDYIEDGLDVAPVIQALEKHVSKWQ